MFYVRQARVEMCALFPVPEGKYFANMETRLRISFLLTYRLTVKLFTLIVESGLGQHAIGFLKSCLGILSRLVLSGPSACFHLERSVVHTNNRHG